ncbi:hypothetical protein [Chlorogloeopsis sp. ULAP02]
MMSATKKYATPDAHYYSPLLLKNLARIYKEHQIETARGFNLVTRVY